jgi:hypothetical protein
VQGLVCKHIRTYIQENHIFLISVNSGMAAAVFPARAVEICLRRPLCTVLVRPLPRTLLRRCCTTTSTYSRPAKHTLAQNYRTAWPDTELEEIVLPKRTVSDDKLRFKLRSSLESGSITLNYPHLQAHPADFKVVMKVRSFRCVSWSMDV